MHLFALINTYQMDYYDIFTEMTGMRAPSNSDRNENFMIRFRHRFANKFLSYHKIDSSIKCRNHGYKLIVQSK